MQFPTLFASKTVLGLVAALTWLPQARSQTVIVDNLSQAIQDYGAVTSTTWVANQFTTDNQSYDLTSVRLNLRTAFNTAGNFIVQIWDDNLTTGPGNLLLTLSGSSNPASAGLYTYIPLTTVTLNPATSYWIAAGVSSGNGIYGWNSTSTSAANGLGSVGGFSVSFDGGATWNGSDPSAHQMFSVSGFSVPEPRSYALTAGAVLLGFAAWRRRNQRQNVRETTSSSTSPR